MEENVLIIKFQRESVMKEFIGWLSDGGGEQEFMNATEVEVDFDYLGNEVTVSDPLVY